MPNDLTLPLGLMDSGKLVVDPFPNLSRLVVGPSGAWKTTTTVTTTNQALIAYPDVAVKTVDHKDGEVYAQFRPVAKKYDRIFGCIDDMGVYGFDNEDRLEVNALGAVISAAKHSPETLTFTINNTTLNIIPEVNDGGRNWHFRESPRQKIHLGILGGLEFLGDHLTPGVLYETMADPTTWRLMRENAIHEGSPALKARAQLSLDMEDREPESYFKHMQAALTPLQIYEPGSVLNKAGASATITHEELCRDGWMIFDVLPQRHAKQVGVHAALHQQSFMDAQMSGRGGRLINVIDEMCNSPQKYSVDLVTIQRSYQTSSIYITQTLLDIERQYGKQELAVLMDNCAVIQYLAISPDDAEKISKLMGEEITVSQSLNINPKQLGICGSLSTGKQPVMTPTELVNLDPAYQLLFIKGFGWLKCRKLRQNQIAPTCFDLGPNPLEDNQVLPPDPKVTLPTSPPANIGVIQ